MEVTREAYPDPTSANPRWLTCDFAPVKTLAHPVSLEAIKADSRLATLPWFATRLAVMPLTVEQFQILSTRSIVKKKRRKPQTSQDKAVATNYHSRQTSGKNQNRNISLFFLDGFS